MRKILIVIDMQNDFIDAALGTKEAVAIVEVVKDKIRSYSPEDVIATMDTHGEDYMETQKRYSKTLPDLSPYITSEPGDPSSYPHDKNDMPAAVKDSWKGHDYEIEWAEKVLDDEEDKKRRHEDI